MKILITFLLFLPVIFCVKCYGQTQVKKDLKEVLVKNEWVTDNILGLDPKTKIYKLTKYHPGKFAGNLTQFVDSITFHSAYTAPCGNDYFTDVSGQYKFPERNKITITVKEVSYSGEWTKPTEHRKINYLTFAISMVRDTIILTKQ
jgi:hypothetical protein